MKFTNTQLRVTDIHDSDETLQTAAAIAKCSTPAVVPQAENEYNDDDDLYKELAVQRTKDHPINNIIGDVCSQRTD